MPLPNHAPVHRDFQSHHAPLIASTFRSGVILSRPIVAGTRNATTGRTAFADPTTLFEGCARIQSRSAGNATQVGDRAVTTGTYLIALPADSEAARVGDLITVVSCPDAPSLVDAVLKIVDVPAADIAWQRSYGCDLEQPAVRG